VYAPGAVISSDGQESEGTKHSKRTKGEEQNLAFQNASGSLRDEELLKNAVPKDPKPPHEQSQEVLKTY